MNDVAIRRPMPVQQYEVSDIELMARAIAGSKLFGINTPEQALALCLIAQSEGRHPASAAQDYHIIQNKPSKKSDAMLRDFLAAGGKVEWHKLDDTAADATFSHPAGGTARISWDMARAKKAQLSTPMWTKYPRQMLRSRVVSEGVRTVFPMATSGMYVPEEVQEFSGEVAMEPDGAPAPARKSAYRARKDGDFDGVAQQVNDCTTVAKLTAWRNDNAAKLNAFPRQWLESFDAEIYDPKLEALQKAEGAKPATLPAKDSDTVAKTLVALLGKCQSASDVDDWRENNRTAFRTLTKPDQLFVAEQRDARLAELFTPDDAELVDDDGVVQE
jgi:hypothetical protein